MKHCKTEEECRVETALDILTGKWKPVILYHLMENKVMRFSELERAIPTITKKMLTNQLRELEYHDIIHREVYPQVPPKVEYSLTEYGKGIESILIELHKWGMAHVQHMNERGEEEKVLEA